MSLGPLARLQNKFTTRYWNQRYQRVFSRTTPTNHTSKIYYIVPDFNTPSWGIGLLYNHVRILRQLGYPAEVLHHRKNFRIDWLEVDVPVSSIQEKLFLVYENDILVVPEVMAKLKLLDYVDCRKILFVQNAFLIAEGSTSMPDFTRIGVRQFMTILPHIKRVLQRSFDLPIQLVPPYIAPYFFSDPEIADWKIRKRQIVVYPKRSDPDYENLIKFLTHRLSRTNSTAEWKLVELKGLTHRAVAAKMQESAIFVCVNCREAFNTSTTEAMAAGCLLVCYEGYGGQDYLKHGYNAFVYQNNDVFGVVDKLIELVKDYNDEQAQKPLDVMRRNAHATALDYREGRSAQALSDCFRDFQRTL